VVDADSRGVSDISFFARIKTDCYLHEMKVLKMEFQNYRTYVRFRNSFFLFLYHMVPTSSTCILFVSFFFLLITLIMFQFYLHIPVTCTILKK